MIKCFICKHGAKDENEYPCKECFDATKFEPNTNADRIRSMDDIELAKFLVKVNSTVQECMVLGCKSALEGECGDCFLEWLQAEVESCE